MCKELLDRWACGHESITQYDNCDKFGSGCFGPKGEVDKVRTQKEGKCSDCIARDNAPNKDMRANDPYKKEGGGHIRTLF